MKDTSRVFPILASVLVFCSSLSVLRAQPAPVPQVWVATWGAAQQIPEPENALSADDLHDSTLRQIFHLSAGGHTLRVHVSNAFGTGALRFTSVHIARPLSASSSAIDPATDQPLTFAGASDVIVPPGAEFVSDPINYPVDAQSNLAVTFHIENAPAQQTGHPGSRATSYFVHGDAVQAAVLADPGKVEHWYQVSEIDVLSSPPAGSIVALGDSITDGSGATTDGNDRWTDVLASRLQQASTARNIGVVNEGIGGNHLLIDGLGPNALARFDRDVLAPSDVRWLIVFEGVNDLGALTRAGEVPPEEHASLVQRVIASYQQIIPRACSWDSRDRCHNHAVYGIGLLPPGRPE
jgi:hypothetical protein